MEVEDPFDFLLKASEVSPSQMELLTTYSFVGDDRDDIFMFSMPETQHGAAAGVSGTQEQDDVFHTPPEKSSAPSSGDMPPSQPSTLNQEALGFVDLVDSVNLGRDFELGQSQGLSHGIKRYAVVEDSGCCSHGKEQGPKKNKKFIFDVLKFLAENLVEENDDKEEVEENDDKEEEEEDASSEDVVDIDGTDFPRPKWWRHDVCIKKP